MRILFITQWFEPEPAFKGLGFAKLLKEHGHEVEVVTAFPNYPGGRLYPGYRVRPIRREDHGGIRVNRVAIYPSHDKSAVRRIINYVSFAFTASLFVVLTRLRFDVVYVYQPPASAAIPALIMKRLRGTPFVLDVQDLWPDAVTATGMLHNALAVTLLSRFCDGVYASADRISVLSPGFKRELTKRGVSPEKISVVYNWSEEETPAGVLDAAPEGWPEEEDSFRVLFAGTMGRVQGLGAVIDAARILSVIRPSVRIIFMGGGVELENLRQSASDLPNVTFVPRQPRDRAAQCLQLADALLVHLVRNPLFEMTIPSKVQAYLAAGRPIVAGVAGDAARLVRDAGAGIECESENPASIAEAICRLADLPSPKRAAMAQRGRLYYTEHLSRIRGVREALRLMREAVADIRTNR